MNVLILGGNSDIGLAIAKEFIKKHDANIQLASRDIDQLQISASDLNLRNNVQCETYLFDAEDISSHSDFYNKLKIKPDVAVVTFGLLGEDQEILQKDVKASLKLLTVNFNGAVSILEIIANDFEQRQSGTIIGISSVAGDRGRASNYIYGASKAGFTAYLSGLRNRLFSHGVKVFTILPGFVKTKMTAHLQLPAPLLAEPEAVAKRVLKGFNGNKDILYVKPIWKWIMLIIKLLPEFLFKRLKL